MYIPTRTDLTTVSHLRPFQSKRSVPVAGTALKEIVKNMAYVSTTRLSSPRLRMIHVERLLNMVQTFQCKRLLTPRAENQTECSIR